MQGAVCPVIPTPVGTGVLIAGGNYNSTDKNWIYDNWRYGTMQFWVPAPLRDEYDPDKLFDTSHHNHTTDNKMGLRPDGSKAHNGMDHWWDDQGNGNCWQGNTYSRGHQTDNFTLDPPSCSEGGSVFTPGLPVKDAGFLTCNQYDRNDETWRHPPGCSWFDSPSKPTGRRPAAGRAAQAADRPVAGPGGRSAVRAARPSPVCGWPGPGENVVSAAVARCGGPCSRWVSWSCWWSASATPPSAPRRRPSASAGPTG